jgi:type I restriction enzyme S subunit
MSLLRYPKYKDSGLPWLGKVPEHWEIGALKHFIRHGSGAIKTGPFGSHLTSAEMLEGSVKVYNQRNVIDGDFVGGENFISEAKFEQLSSFETFPGDVLVTTRGTIGRAAILPENAERGILHPCLLRVQPDAAKLHAQFFLALIQDSSLLRTQISLYSNATTIEVIYTETMASLVIPVPPLQEQANIIAFLDRENDKIDALIAEQEKLLVLLAEKRQATISHAVTRGLNRDAQMKESGVTWLGSLPTHWQRVQLGRLCRQVSDGPHFSPIYVEEDEGVMFLSARNIKVGGWSLGDAKYVSKADYEDFCKRVIPEKGDVLYTKGGTTGVARVVDLEVPFQVWVHVAVLKIRRELADPYFVAYALNSIGCYEQSQLLTRGATNNDLGLTRMVRIMLALPPVEEQRDIVAFLDAETERLDALKSRAERSIELLRERRTAVIAAAVTGKIDVRGAVASPVDKGEELAA